MGYFDDDEKPQPADPKPFTSTLGVAEFALLGQLSCAALGQVQGTSFHHVGWVRLPPQAQWGGEVFCTVDALAQAWNDARERAFARLRAHATECGSDAVVGVRLSRGEHSWARGMVDYVVSGTAIRVPGEPAPTDAPALSDLSMGEYVKLIDAGWEPADLVAATSVVFVSQSSGRRWRVRLTMLANQELSEYSRGFTAARDDAVAQLRRQARAAGADGVVGVRLQHSIAARRLRVATAPGRQRSGLGVTTLALGADAPRGGADHREGVAITIHAVGTAIRRRARPLRASSRPILRL